MFFKHWLSVTKTPAFCRRTPYGHGRKPNGQGRLALQKKRRDNLACVISEKISNSLDHEVVEQTGSLFPRVCNLRKRDHRRFSFLKHVGEGKRMFTKKLCHSVTKKVARSLPYQLVFDPKLTLEQHLQAQATRLQLLARRVKRMADETQPYASAPVCLYMQYELLKWVSTDFKLDWYCFRMVLRTQRPRIPTPLPRLGS